MRVAELMRQDFVLLHRDDSVEIAAKAMAESDSGAVLIEGDNRLVGLLTACDLLVRVTAAGRDPSATPLWQIMSANLYTCTEEDEAERAAAQMAAWDIEQMPVVDRAGRRSVFSPAALWSAGPHLARDGEPRPDHRKACFSKPGRSIAEARQERANHPSLPAPLSGNGIDTTLRFMENLGRHCR